MLEFINLHLVLNFTQVAKTRLAMRESFSIYDKDITITTFTKVISLSGCILEVIKYIEERYSFLDVVIMDGDEPFSELVIKFRDNYYMDEKPIEKTMTVAMCKINIGLSVLEHTAHEECVHVNNYLMSISAAVNDMLRHVEYVQDDVHIQNYSTTTESFCSVETESDGLNISMLNNDSQPENTITRCPLVESSCKSNPDINYSAKSLIHYFEGGDGLSDDNLEKELDRSIRCYDIDEDFYSLCLRFLRSRVSYYRRPVYIKMRDSIAIAEFVKSISLYILDDEELKNRWYVNHHIISDTIVKIKKELEDI